MRLKAPNKLVITLFLLIFSVSCHPSPTQALAVGSDSASQGHEVNVSPTITVEEAEALVNLPPAIKELRAKGMVVKWDVQAIPTMNGKDYYHFWAVKPRRSGRGYKACPSESVIRNFFRPQDLWAGSAKVRFPPLK
jgi:hypothetical protein